MEKWVDYDIIIQAIASYLVWAMDFIWEYKNTFSIWLIPDGHHIYTWTLKAAWYRLLKPAKTLVLIWDWAVNDKICVLDSSVDFFMWKKWRINKAILSKLIKSNIVDFVQHRFDRIDAELPFLRVISDYDNIVFMEVWDWVSKTKITNLLSDISKNANLMFMSDFHRDMPIESCKELDNQILDLNFVKKDKNLFLIEIFLRLSRKLKKNPDLLAYLNTWDVSTDKKITNWFWCMFL